MKYTTIVLRSKQKKYFLNELRFERFFYDVILSLFAKQEKYLLNELRDFFMMLWFSLYYLFANIFFLEKTTLRITNSLKKTSTISNSNWNHKISFQKNIYYYRYTWKGNFCYIFGLKIRKSSEMIKEKTHNINISHHNVIFLRTNSVKRWYSFV